MDKIRNVLSKAFTKRMIVLYVAVILVTVILYQIVTSVMLCNMIFGDRAFADSAVAKDLVKGDFATAEGRAWLNSVAEDEFIEKDDGHKLHALRVNNEHITSSYIIIYHPVTLTSADMADYAYHFADIGFNVILPDLRGCGESDYTDISFGATDTEDIMLWVNKIVEADPEATVFLFGVGAGGTAVLTTCDEGLPENVKGIIEDSGYDSLKDVFKNNIEKYYNKKSFPALLIADTYVNAKYGWSISDVNINEQVHQSTVPILFIHGGKDEIVPVSHSNDMYEVCPAIGTKHLLIGEADHCRGMQADSKKYWRTVDEFIIVQMGE